MCCISLCISEFPPGPLPVISSQHRSCSKVLRSNFRLKNTHFKNRKGNAEMSVCNSSVAVVTKDLLVLLPSAGFWSSVPITERSQPAAISTFPSIIYTFHRGHVHPSICSQHTPTSSRPPSVCIFTCSLVFFYPVPIRNPSHCHLGLICLFLQPSTAARAAHPCTDARNCRFTPTCAIPPSGSNFFKFSRYAPCYCALQIRTAQFFDKAHTAASCRSDFCRL